MCSRVVQLRFPNLPYGLTIIFQVRIPKHLHLQTTFAVPSRRDRIVVAYQIKTTDSGLLRPASADGRGSAVECVQTEKRGGEILSSSASLLLRSQPTFKTQTWCGCSGTVKPCPKQTPRRMFHFGFPPLGFFFFVCVCFRKVLFVPTEPALGRQSSLTYEPEVLFDLNGFSWIRTQMIIVAILTLTDPLMRSLTPTDTVGRSRPPKYVTKISFTVYLCFLNRLKYIFGFRKCVKYRIKGNKSVNSKNKF